MFASASLLVPNFKTVTTTRLLDTVLWEVVARVLVLKMTMPSNSMDILTPLLGTKPCTISEETLVATLLLERERGKTLVRRIAIPFLAVLLV